MKKLPSVISILVLGASMALTVGADHAAAQGPAGVGASTSTQQTTKSSSSGHSLNPIKWVKKDKDSKNSVDSNGSRSEVEKKLTPKLQTAGLLPSGVNATDSCAPFTALNECLAVLHASHNIDVDFNCLRAGVTGVHTSADLSGCKVPDGEKAQTLAKAIHQLKPEVNAKEQTKSAEEQAKADLRDLGS